MENLRLRLLTFGGCFRFPLSTRQGRRDVLVGGTLLLTLLVGWVLNLGHRLEVVHRFFGRQPPYFRGFAPWPYTFVRGLTAAMAIGSYLSPSVVLGIAAHFASARGHAGGAIALSVLAGAAFVVAVFSLPGGMTHNAAYRDMALLYRPDLAFRIAVKGGRAYLKAWGIALSAITLSLFGVILGGVGVLYTSVWAWSVVGYAFSLALLPESELPDLLLSQNTDQDQEIRT